MTINIDVYKEMMEDFHDEFIEVKLSKMEVQMFNPLALAYVGDSVYELLIRSYLVSKGNRQVKKLHLEAIAFVKAKAQAVTLAELSDILTDEEREIVRRGRNTKAATVPKNAELMDYRMATGLETLFGYLYLTGRMDRIMELANIIINDHQ